MKILPPLTIVAAGFLLITLEAQARPDYAKREKKPCAFCHFDSNGGGPRNARGTYYESNNLSLIGFRGDQDDKVAAKKSGPPAFKKTWQIDLPKASRRIAVADVNADRKPRLLVLGEGGELTVFRPATMGLTKEATIDLGPSASRFVAGKFAKDKPAVIAVPGAIHYHDGDGFKSKKADVAEITGSVRFVDGAEYFFFFAGAQPDVYGVDLGAANPLSSGRDMVLPEEGSGVYSIMVAHLPGEILAGLGVPEEALAPGVVGLIDARADNKLYAFWARQTKDGGNLELVDAAGLSPANAGGNSPKPVWSSPKIVGKILDVAPGLDPKEGKTLGFYILHTAGAENQDRVVEFFELD